jgi:hypothetical protein
MKNHRRTRSVCSIAALLTAAGAAWCAGGGRGTQAAVLTLVTLGLLAAAVREARAHGRTVRAHRLAVRAALGTAPRLPAPEPCCDFWRNADVTDHRPGCVRADGPAAEVARGWQELHSACCLHGWESRGAVHDPAVCASRAAA